MKTSRVTRLILPILAAVAFCVGTGAANAALSEGFNATGWGASYGTYTVNGWVLTSVFRETTSKYEGAAAIRFSSAGTRSIVSPQNAAGIGTVSFWHRRWSATDGTVNFSVYVSSDGSTWGTAIATGSSTSDTYTQFSQAVNDAAAKYVKIDVTSGKRWLVDLAEVSDAPSGPAAPSVSTVAASGIGTTSATANGNVTDDGGDTVTERGVVYKTSSGVAITDNPTAAAAGGTGEFSVDLSSLDVNQIYYFRAYAINGVDTTLAANELNFTTLANVPGAPTVDNPTATTLDVTIDANGNPASTEFAILRTNDGQYLQANGSAGASAVWQTAAAWGTVTATGLSPSTDYGFQVKARNGANVETAFGDESSESTTAAASGIWINPMSAGAPMGSLYVGDVLGEWYVNFEIGQQEWNYAQVGIGTSAEGIGYNWGEATWYQDGDWPNKRVRRNLSGFQFTSAANYYVICQAKANSGDDYTSKSGNGWGNSTLYPPADLASAYFTVAAIDDASDLSAAADDADPTHAIDLGWNKNTQGHGVMIVRKAPAASWTEPTQGTSYSVSDTLGAGTVVYVGSDTSTTDSGLSAGSTYDYKFYSVNNGYYAAGVTTQGETLPCEPDAPTGLYASETNETDFTATWTASDRATGYRLDVSTSATFSSAGDTPETLFTESMGTVGTTTTIANHEAADGFDNDAYTMSAGGAANPADIRATSTSSGYTGASGAANVYFTSTANSYGFGIAGIDVSGYGSLNLSFGYRKESATANATFALEYSTDGSTWTPVTVTGLPAENAATGWYLVSGVELPPGAASPTLSLRWVKSGSIAMRIDDVKLVGTPSTPSFVAGYENLAVAGTSQLVEGLDDNTTYYFRVRAEGEGGCPSANSDTASVTTLESIGGPQTIDFPAIADKVTTDVVELSATASSGLPVSFSVFSGPAELDEDGVTLSFTGAGEVSVVASQAGGGGWDPADPVTNTFNVTKAIATVTLGDLAQAYDGTPRAASVATVPAGLTVSVTYDGEAAVPTDPGQYEVIATVVDDLYQGSDTETLTISVASPASFSGVSAGMDAVELSFTPNAAGNDVVIVVNGTGVFDDPAGAPVVGEALAGGTVLYVGSESPQTHAGLDSCTPYYYKAWSYVDGFYSSGLAGSANTDGPNAPTGLSAVPDYASFVASWDAVSGAAGYRLDVSTEADFATGGGAGSVYVADFEDASKTSYGAGSVILNGISWTLNEAVIGDLANDRKNGLKSARVRSNETVNATGILAMNEDLATGLSSIAFLHGKYGTDADTTGRVEYSTDGGQSWTSAGTFTANSTTLTPFSVTNLNVAGNVRVRIVKTSGTTARYNVDDIKLYPYDPPTPSFVAGYENLAVAGTSQEVSGLAEGVTYYFRVRAEGANCASADSAVASTTTLEHLRLVLNKTAVNVREAGEGRFFVRLNKAPEETVQVNVARVSGDAGLDVKSGGLRTFTAATWSEWQAVTLAAAADENAANEEATFVVAASGGIGGEYVAATALDDDLGENLALASGGAVAWATGAASRPEQLIDGVHAASTNYAFATWTNDPRGTITLDLKTMATVTRIRLLNWDWLNRSQRYAIEHSTDAANWSPLVDASGADRQGWDDWAVASQSLRYLRITGLTNSANQYVVVPELEVYGTRDLTSLAQPVVYSAAVNVREGGEGRFFVRLDKEPDGLVELAVSRSDGSEDVEVAGGSVRIFKPSNWNVWQAVTLVAAADGNADGETATFRVSAPGRIDQFVTATVLDGDVGANLASPASGSTLVGKGASKVGQMVDGVHNVSTNYGWTIWTNVPPGTLTLDMQRSMILGRIRLLNWDWIFRTQRYTIESSENGVVWTPLADASGEDHLGWDEWTFSEVSARYLRIVGLTNSANQCFLVSELEVYGEPGPLPQLAVSTTDVKVRENGEGRFYVRIAEAPEGNVPVTVARVSGDAGLSVQSGADRSFTLSTWNAWQAVTLAAANDEDAEGETATFRVSAPGYEDVFVTATALDDEIGENLALASAGTTVSGAGSSRRGQLIDGVHNVSTNYAYTTWTSTPPGTIVLDLGGLKSLTRVRLLNWDWTYRTQRYRIDYSQDGSEWFLGVDATAGDHSGWEDWALAGTPTARYVRFTGLANSANAYVLVSELEVYGTAAGRRSAGRAPAAAVAAGGAIAESEPVAVLTSEGPADETGWNAVDGDDATAWVGQKAGGGYLVVEYQPTLTLAGLEVDVTEASLADAQVLTSLDGQDWQPLPDDLEANPVSLNFLWIVFPDDGTDAVPEVIEVRPNP